MLVLGVILAFVVAKPVGTLIYQARHTFRTERYLMVENGNLLYNKQTWGSGADRSYIKRLKQSNLTAESNGREIEISLNGKIFRRTSLATNIIVSSKNQIVFFTEYEILPTAKSGRATAYQRLFKWTKSGGFESMNPSGVGTSSPRLSCDEQVLLEDNYWTTPIRGGAEMYDLKTKQTSPFKNMSMNIEAVVSANEFLSIHRDRKSADDAYGQLYRIDIASGKSKLVLPGHLAGQVVAFDGAIWVLIKTVDGTFQVVSLSPSLDRIEEKVSVK